MAKKLYKNGRRVDEYGKPLPPAPRGEHRPIQKNARPGIERRENQRTGKVSFRAHFHRVGVPTKVMTFPTEQEAIYWLALKNLAYRERGQAPSHETLKSIILRTAIEEYIQYELKPDKLPTEKRLADRVKSDLWVLRQFKNNRICNCNLADWNIDGLAKIAKYVDHRSAKHREDFWEEHHRNNNYVIDVDNPNAKPAPIGTLGERPNKGVLFSTIRREFNLLQVVFKTIGKTYHHGLINHFAGYELPYPKDDDNNKSNNERTRVLEPGELERIEAACMEHCTEKTRDETLAVIYLAIETGMRQATLFNMKWVHLFDEFRTLRIPVDKKGPRTICVSFLANRIIERVFGEREEEFVIPRRGRKDPQGAFEERWQNIIKHSGLEDFEFLDLRRTARLRFYAAQLNDLQSAIMLGHRHSLITNRNYLPKGDPVVMEPILELLDRDILGVPLGHPIDKSFMYGRMVAKGYGDWIMNTWFSKKDRERYHQAEADKPKIKKVDLLKQAEQDIKKKGYTVTVIPPDGPTTVTKREFD